MVGIVGAMVALVAVIVLGTLFGSFWVRVVAKSLLDFPRPPGHGAYLRRLNRLAVLGGAV